MVMLSTQRDFREVQILKWCHVCGRDFLPTERKSRDHVPPQAVFAKNDRTPSLWLPAHVGCNGARSALDKKIGQLIALKRFEAPATRRDRALQFKRLSLGVGVVENLNIHQAVWGWVRAFHIALYQERLPAGPLFGGLQTPFPSGTLTSAGMRTDPILPQHLVIVDTIKTQRANGNLDKIRSNNGKLVYECVWCQADNRGPWLCFYALNLYDWKDLGLTSGQPARGCAGFYKLRSGMPPPKGTRMIPTSLIVPNLDQLDPFAP